jgi:chromate reductase
VSRTTERSSDAIAHADAILFATPEYKSSIPGQLKNAVDWTPRPVNEAVLRNKPVAVIGARASAYGALWAQAELRKVLAAAGARVIDREEQLHELASIRAKRSTPRR